MKLRWASHAQSDVRELVAYIAKENPDAARLIRDRIGAAAAHLEEFPRPEAF